MGLLDFMQAASNAAASNVSGPVDGLAWLLRKVGVDVQDPVGGSAWMERQGLTKPVQPGGAQVAGETFGLLAPLVAAAKAPQVAGGLLKAIENASAQKTMGAGMSGGQRGAVAAAAMTDAEREAAMRAAGFERGWYRGGEQLKNGRKSGDWYTQYIDEAKDYGARIPNADVREYAVPIKNTMHFDRGYPSRMAHDLASKVEGMGEKGRGLAAELRSYGPDERITGSAAWMGLKNWLGEDAAAQALSEIGWRAVKGVNSPNYLRLLPGGTVRDAASAKFDPSRLNVDDVFGAADPALLAALGGGLGLAGYLRTRGGE